MTAADDLVGEISSILFLLNTDITVITQLMNNAEALAAKIEDLQTHQFDLQSSAGILHTGIPDKFREVLNRYKLVVDKLENYRAHI